MNKNNIVVTNIQMPFSSMVIFMVKWAIASIPAAIVLIFIGMVCMGALSTMGKGV